jgi:DNA-binding response OmpR family regulator
MSGRRIPQVVPIDEAPPADTSEYRPSVLVVDDESAIADTMTEILSRSGYLAMTAYDAEEALETALLTPPELLITDVMLPGMSGIELAITMRRIFPDCKILLCSGQAIALDLLSSARNEGHNFTLLTKPVHPRELLARIAECFEHVPQSTAKTSSSRM